MPPSIQEERAAATAHTGLCERADFTDAANIENTLRAKLARIDGQALRSRMLLFTSVPSTCRIELEAILLAAKHAEEAYTTDQNRRFPIYTNSRKLLLG